MIVVCEQCNRKFKLDEAKVPEAGIKVKCSKCGHTFRVHRPDAQPEAPAGASPETPPTPDSSPPSTGGASAPDTGAIDDVLQSGGDPVFGSSSEDEFGDLFADDRRADDSPADDSISDLFGPGSSEADGPSSPFEPSEPEGKPAPEVEGFDLGQSGDDPFGKEGGFDPGEEDQAASFLESPAETSLQMSKDDAAVAGEEKKEYPEWGTIEFGEETGDTAMPELEAEEVVEEPEPEAWEEPEPAPSVSSARSAPDEGAPAPVPTREAPRTSVGEKPKPQTQIGEIPRLVMEVSFLAIMVLLLFGMGVRFLLHNPAMLKRVGLSSLSDSIYFQEIAERQEVLVFDHEANWIENRNQVPVLLIEGRVFNGTGAEKSVSRLVAKLKGPDGKPLLSQAMPIGVVPKVEEIRNLPADELRNLIQKRAVEMRLPAYGEFSFRFPIPGVDPQKISYQIEVE